MQKRTRYGLIVTAVTASGVLAFAIPALANGDPSPSYPPTVIPTVQATTPSPVYTTPSAEYTPPPVTGNLNCYQATDEEFIFAYGHREVFRTEQVLVCQVPGRYPRTVVIPEVGAGR